MIYLAALSLLFAPAYAIRFNLAGIPTNLLMVWLFFVDAIILYGFFKFPKSNIGFSSNQKRLLFFSGLFFLSGILALFVNGFSQEKLAQFVVLFLQPLLWFFYFVFHPPLENEKQKLVFAAFILSAVLGLIALLQYFTLFSLPEIYWGNNVEPKRAVSVFSHPNFYALFIAPLLAFLIPFAFKIQSKIKTVLWIIGFLGLALSLSRSGWLGLGAAIGIFALTSAEKQMKKLLVSGAVILSLIVLITPNLRYRVMLPFYGEKSAVSRLSLWTTGVKAIKESPVFGLGLKGFANNWDRLNSDPNLTQSHNLPHNIFLNTWVSLGLLGLLSFFYTFILSLYLGFKHKDNPYKLGVALFLVAFFIQGQIDNPYFKNDLALTFWLVLSFLF